MRYRILISVLLLFTVTAYSQERNFTVLGKVIDSATQQNLPGASVFAENTTFGTVTNAEGLFFLRLANGGYDLVISYTGYDKKMIRVSNTSELADTLLVSLAKQDASLTEVAVVASNEVEDGWNKYGSFFTEHFIGTTPNSDSCTLQNPEALRFFYTKTKKRHRLKVTTKEDLIIRNAALGYMIRYQLDSFSYDYNTNISQYTGSPFFTEIDSIEEVKTQWVKNRAKTYLGSRLHFMRSLYDGTVQEEGFIVEKLEGRSTRNLKATQIENLYDSSLYVADSNVVEIPWHGRYRVNYKNVFPDKRFLEEFKLPETVRMQATVLDVSDGFVIEENGYFYEQYDVINTGYWAWKKLAELLPYDYVYE
jgi:hypothetical protein